MGDFTIIRCDICGIAVWGGTTRDNNAWKRDHEAEYHQEAADV